MGLGQQNNNFACASLLFCTVIALPLLQDHDMKLPNFMFCGGSKWTQYNNFLITIFFFKLKSSTLVFNFRLLIHWHRVRAMNLKTEWIPFSRDILAIIVIVVAYELLNKLITWSL